MLLLALFDYFLMKNIFCRWILKSFLIGPFPTSFLYFRLCFVIESIKMFNKKWWTTWIRTRVPGVRCDLPANGTTRVLGLPLTTQLFG